MRPWERRLRDLSRLLASCGQTYFSPDLFRQNTNQFLQTSRTVTFIIQKNKHSIPDFDTWYKTNVLVPWSADSVMTWAKDARNVIEKEGDLEMYSTLHASLLFSHITAQDVSLATTKSELLKANVEKLLQVASTKLPPGIASAAVLRIERRWVANSLPSHELIFAMTYAYGRLYSVATSLARHLNSTLDATVPHPTTLDPARNDVPRTRYIKLGKPGIGRLKSTRISADPNFVPPPALLALKSELAGREKPSSLAQVVDGVARMAQVTFDHYGNHVPMLFLFDDEWRQIDFLSTAFADQADKFVFWRHAADRAGYLRAYALVWISESWLRDMQNRGDAPMSELPIIGEHLNVIGVSVDDNECVVSWEIHRGEVGVKPALVPTERSEEETSGTTIFFVKPVLEAMKAARARRAG